MLGLGLELAAAAQVSSVDTGEEILFYPASARLVENGTLCEAQISGMVYELESRRITLSVLRQTLGLGGVHMTPAQQQTFTTRSRLFMVDHESREKIIIRLGQELFKLGPTHGNGLFSGTIRWQVPAEGIPAAGVVEFQAVLPEKDGRHFSGRLFFTKPGGLLVVSDVDDTIKETGVGNRKALLKNTFLEPFQPVPGMAALYRRLEARGAVFHYVSASPWQLFTPLDEFRATNGYPAGVFHLKNFRFKDETFFSLFQKPDKYKMPLIEGLIQQAPDVRFVLIGDSGEKDPEVYSALARKYPDRIWKIFIRRTPGATNSLARHDTLSHGLRPGTLVFFDEPGELTF